MYYSTMKTFTMVPLFLLILLITVSCQDIDDDTKQKIEEIFITPSGTLPGLEEVTKAPAGDLGALQKCGEGTSKGESICVPYYQCDGKTKTVVQTGVTDGFGIIDIRFGENGCDHPLDVCCKLPKGGLDPDGPKIGERPPPPSTDPPIGPGPGPLPTTPAPVMSYCGTRNNNGVDFQITGDKDNEAEYGEFPWVIAILDKKESNAPLKCGGSLITPNVVLTAAHCVAAYKSKMSDLTIRAGEWDTQTSRERLPYQERDVKEIIIHDDFNPKTAFSDFALLVLDKSIARAEHIGTICLPRQGEEVDSKECFVSGWGKDVFGRHGTFQAILKKIELSIVKRQKCQSDLRKTRLGGRFQLHSSFICAGGEAGKDACTGDGGSPLVCPDPHNPTRYIQAGIVSWGIGCGEADVPGVYADVSKFRSWIDAQMERLNFDTSPYNV